MLKTEKNIWKILYAAQIQASIEKKCFRSLHFNRKKLCREACNQNSIGSAAAGTGVQCGTFPELFTANDSVLAKILNLTSGNMTSFISF